MPTFLVQRVCGHTLTVQAETKDEALAQLKAALTQVNLDEHFKMYHAAWDAKPTLDQVLSEIQQAYARDFRPRLQ